MSEPAQLDPASVIRETGKQWLTEVTELRRVKVPDASASLSDVHETLVEVRGNLDRVEEIYAQAMALRSATRARAGELADSAEEKLDRAVSDRAARARDFEGTRERLAQASIDALEERRAARSAQRLDATAESFEKRIRLHYYGLVGLREELTYRLRHVSWESSLDR